MGELLTPPENSALLQRQSIIEAMLPPELLEVRKGLFLQLNNVERDIKIINDVLDGYGYTEAIIESTTGIYDANDGTQGSPEHPEDSQWNPAIIRGED